MWHRAKETNGGNRRSDRRWADLLGPFLAITMAALAVVVVAGHVFLVSRREVDQLSTLLLNLLALVFSSICTIWVGRWSALRENKAFIRAALRNTYGLLEGLKVAEQAALEGINRMSQRSMLAGDVQAAFWTEAIGRVVDHVRSLIRRAQETVANWQEFGPEEVERLAHAEVLKEAAISELRTATQEVTAVLRSVSAEDQSAVTERLRARVEALEHETERLETSSALSVPARGEARKLLAMGALEEAIDAYSALIADGSGGHSIYLARGRARYLAGDRAGALEDIKQAQAIDPSDPSVVRLRRDIEEGRTLAPVLAAAGPSYKPAVSKGNLALAEGDGERARRCFDEAKNLGLFPVFCAQNEAMACLLLGRPVEARETVVRALPETSGPFVRVQALALLAMSEAAAGQSPEATLGQLASAVAALGQLGSRFDVAQSPLQFLFSGLQRNGAMQPPYARVLAILASGMDPGLPETPATEPVPPGSVGPSWP